MRGSVNLTAFTRTVENIPSQKQEVQQKATSLIGEKIKGAGNTTVRFEPKIATSKNGFLRWCGKIFQQLKGVFQEKKHPQPHHETGNLKSISSPGKLTSPPSLLSLKKFDPATQKAIQEENASLREAMIEEAIADAMEYQGPECSRAEVEADIRNTQAESFNNLAKNTVMNGCITKKGANIKAKIEANKDELKQKGILKQPQQSTSDLNNDKIIAKPKASFKLPTPMPTPGAGKLDPALQIKIDQLVKAELKQQIDLATRKKGSSTSRDEIEKEIRKRDIKKIEAFSTHAVLYGRAQVGKGNPEAAIPLEIAQGLETQFKNNLQQEPQPEAPKGLLANADLLP